MNQGRGGSGATKHGLSRLSHGRRAGNRPLTLGRWRGHAGERGEEVLEQRVGLHAYIPMRHITASLPALIAKRSASAGVAQP